VALNPLIKQVRCETCGGYAWSSKMAPVRDRAGALHHPSCPNVRQLDEGQCMIQAGRLVRWSK
jgi:hypothetical protein